MKNKAKSHIIFIVPYPYGVAPSQRFRFEQYLALLKKDGFYVYHAPFLDYKTWHILYKKKKYLKKIKGVLKGYLKRIKTLVLLKKFDFIFIHREASPLGPPFFELIVAKLWKKKIIYDFDDAIWLPNTSKENKLISALKWHGKTRKICQLAWKISAGNEYLKNFALQYNSNVVLTPTTIETKSSHIPCAEKSYSKTLTLGWTGTHSTLSYLKLIEKALYTLQQEIDFKILIISNQPPDLALNNIDFLQWNKQTEIHDLCNIDIGLMPLTNNAWTKGKCGFKALQFMALQIPVIASSVGTNKKIIENGYNGLLVESDQKNEWTEKIKSLIYNKQLRDQLGKNGRETVEKKYSVNVNYDIYKNFLFRTN